jgi:hypothetical protein
MSDLDKATMREANEAIAHALGVIDAATPKECTGPVRERLPGEVQQWHVRVLRLPTDLATVPCALYLSPDGANDVVRFQWTHDDWNIVEYQTPTVLAVWVRSTSQAMRAPTVSSSEVSRLARSLFNVAAEFVARSPSTKEQTPAFSTAPTTSVHAMPEWSMRVDAGNHDGILHFLFYKRNPQLLGLGMGGPWFDDEFRRKNR